MSLYPPIPKYKHASYPEGSVTQWFAENPKLYRPWGLAAHNGIDIVAPHGTDLYAVEDAIVINVRTRTDGYGAHVRILSKETYDGANREWVYGHMSRIDVVPGQVVKAGDVLGAMGNTGFVVSGATPWWEYNPYAGTHLHLGLRMAVRDDNGFKYHSQSPAIRILNYDNGYKGSIDWRPLMGAHGQSRKTQQMLTLISLLKTVLSILQNKKKYNESI